jgi:hypothetical protein
VTTKPPEKPKGKPSIEVLDPSILTAEEKAALRAKALERVAKEHKDAVMDAYLADEIKKARRAHQPSEELKYITLDMAGHAQYISLDGMSYWHGQTYEVPKRVYDTLAEIVSRGWDHEDEIGGANRDQYRRPRHVTLRPGMEHASSTQLSGRGR